MKTPAVDPCSVCLPKRGMSYELPLPPHRQSRHRHQKLLPSNHASNRQASQTSFGKVPATALALSICGIRHHDELLGSMWPACRSGRKWSYIGPVDPTESDRSTFRASEIQNPWDYLYDVTDGCFCAIVIETPLKHFFVVPASLDSSSRRLHATIPDNFQAVDITHHGRRTFQELRDAAIARR